MKPEEKGNADQTTTSAGVGSPSGDETQTPAEESESESLEELQKGGLAMKSNENDKEERTTASATAPSPPTNETPTPDRKWESITEEEASRLYVNLRTRLRSLAWAIQQPERLHREMDGCQRASERLWRGRGAGGLSAEEQRRVTRLNDAWYKKLRLRWAWEISIFSLLLAIFPKAWTGQPAPLDPLVLAQGVAELDPDQEMDFEAEIPSDFMPCWGREALEDRLRALDLGELGDILEHGWTYALELSGDEVIEPPDLPRAESTVVGKQLRVRRKT
jgi:hypothetical protein